MLRRSIDPKQFSSLLWVIFFNRFPPDLLSSVHRSFKKGCGKWEGIVWSELKEGLMVPQPEHGGRPCQRNLRSCVAPCRRQSGPALLTRGSRAYTAHSAVALLRTLTIALPALFLIMIITARCRNWATKVFLTFILCEFVFVLAGWGGMNNSTISFWKPAHGKWS